MIPAGDYRVYAPEWRREPTDEERYTFARRLAVSSGLRARLWRKDTHWVVTLGGNH
jgi:hypothetical protein